MGVALLIVTIQMSFALAAESKPETIVDSLEQTQFEKLTQTKKTLRFHEDGNFKILVLSDIHGDGAHLPAFVIDYIRTLVDRESPDLVLFNGDNTWKLETEEVLRSCLMDMVGYIESRKIPWAHVYGNHDDEWNALPRRTQQAIYESFPFCVSKSGDKQISGVSNYVLPILHHEGDKIAFNIWAIDSGTYLPEQLKNQVMPVESAFKGLEKSPYAYIKTDQILWYYQSSLLIDRKSVV